MARDDLFEVEGTVREVLPGSMARVVTDGGQELLATISGQAKRRRIRPRRGDRVLLHVSLYDLNRGRIIDRLVTSRPAEEL